MLPRQPSATRLLGVVLSVLCGTAALASSADASRIVYLCAPDVCAANPETGAHARITTDGAARPYRFPSVSRDGKHVAAARGADVVVDAYGSNLTTRWTGERDINAVALSPDGTAVAESHSYVRLVNRFRCAPFGGCGLNLELEDASGSSYARADRGIVGRTVRGGGGVGFLGDGALLSSYYTLEPSVHTVCVVANPAAENQPCEPRVVRPTALTDLDGSPDGHLIAAAVGAPAPATSTSVQLFDAATGATVRTLADPAADPAFSPDGEQVAYLGADGWIYVVPTAGGTAHRVVRGTTPSWGDGTPPGGDTAGGASLRSTKLRYRKGRIAVKVRCAGSSTCRGTLRIRKGKRTVGSRKYRVTSHKRATVSVKPSRRGRRTLAQARKQRVRVTLTPSTGEDLTKKLTLRR